MTEPDYLAEVYKLAEQAGVLVHHCGDSRRCHGLGFPDLVLVGVHGLLWREIKAGPGDRPTPEQTAFLWLLRAADEDAEIWTEDDLIDGTVEREILSLV